jgi:type II secretory pathway component PulJ
MNVEAQNAKCERPAVTGRRGGFTLIEVLLAAGAFAIVLVAIHMVFHSALRLRNRTAAQIENALPLQQTFQWLRRDLANLVLPGGTFFGPLQTTPGSTPSSGQLGSTPLATLADEVPGQSSPELYTTTARIDDLSPWGEVQRVSYHLADPTNAVASRMTGRDLVRSVTRNLLPVLEDPPEEQRLLSGVESILFYYYDGQQWLEAWDSTTRTNELPRAIKVAIQLTPPEKTGSISASAWAPVELIVPIMVRAGTNQTASTGGGAS